MPDRLIRWATHGRASPGPKQVFVFTLGGLAVLRGLGYVWPDKLTPGLEFLDEVMPLPGWGWVWVATGLAALLGAFTRHYTLPIIPLAVISTLWATSYAVAWGASDWVSRDWITSVSYIAQAVACLTVVRLIDPPEVELLRGGDGH